MRLFLTLLVAIYTVLARNVYQTRPKPTPIPIISNNGARGTGPLN